MRAGKSSGQKGWLAYLGDAEGYLALALVLLLLLLPCSGISIDEGPVLNAFTIFVTLFATGSGFGVAGVRFGHRYAGRLAGGIALTLFFLMLLLYVFIIYI